MMDNILLPGQVKEEFLVPLGLIDRILILDPMYITETVLLETCMIVMMKEAPIDEKED